MSFFSKFFGSGTPDPDPAGMRELMKNPAMREIATELHHRLPHEDRQELVRLIMERNPQKVQEFLQTRVPDLEARLKKAGGGV